MRINQKQAARFRHEQKYILSPLEDHIIAHRLRKLLQHDEHADSHGKYRVSSLYFDSPSDKALRQKIDGVNKREKFRIRYYNEDLSYIRLEKKIKLNGLCAKYSAPLSREQVERILDGTIDFLIEQSDPLLLEFYSKLKGERLQPKTIVAYEREAFSYAPGNVRVTFDRALCSGLRRTDFLDPGAPLIKAAAGEVILEIKYDEFLPQLIQLAVQKNNCSRTAYSKYAVCRRFD